MILGLDAPTSGEVTIDGQRYRDLHQPLTKVGALLDAKWVHPNRSARAHLAWMAASNKLPKSSVDKVLEMVGLTAVANKRAGAFSLGMSQRLGIAGALLGDPEVLLFDEPVNGLDPEGILWIRRFMHRLADEGRTVFVSSHLLSEMALTADHLIVIGRGKLIAATSVAEFIARSSDNYVLVRTDQTDRLLPFLDAATSVDLTDGSLHVSGLDCRTIGDIAATHFIALHELSPQMASLEDAFMELTHDSVDYDARKVA